MSVAGHVVRPLVKVCGVRTLEGVQACNTSEVSFVGINLVPGGKRAVSSDQARQLNTALKGPIGVGVFRNQPLDEVVGLARQVGLTVVQLHGAESPQQCRALTPEFAVFKAIDAQQARDSGLVAAYARYVEMFVVDGRVPGSGQTWDFAALSLVDGDLGGVPVLLAGGLRPENVAEAMAAVAPAGVDCASGVEFVDGPHKGQRMDPARVAAFAEAARG